MKNLLAWLRHPVIELAWRLAAKNRRLRHECDVLGSELAVAKCREKRWKRAAYAACDGNPEAIRLLDFQSMSDDWADEPEIEAHRRNSSPRSAP